MPQRPDDATDQSGPRESRLNNKQHTATLLTERKHFGMNHLREEFSGERNTAGRHSLYNNRHSKVTREWCVISLWVMAKTHSGAGWLRISIGSE